VKVITNTVVDMARVKYLQGTIDMKDHAMAEMQVMANERENKIRSQRKWFWLFWVLIIIIGGYTFLKLRFKLPI
jgi:phosphoglycerol transferase MdoB-like AlkP superfamily enzyme